MDIKRAGTQPSGKGPADWFTGAVRIDPLFQAPDPALVAGASVTFEPGARTAWHTHPLGQTLVVTAGCGWAQRDGRETMSFDVIVAGAGPGGLAAAVTASRAGLRVCLIDPLDRVGGNAAVSTGYVSVLGSDEQRRAGISDSADLYVRDLLREVEQYRGEADVERDDRLGLAAAEHQDGRRMGAG